MLSILRRYRFIAGRSGHAIVVLTGVSILVFVLARAIPGDPARLALGPSASSEQVAQLRLDMGLDEPLLIQYYNFVTNALRLDFGVSIFTNRAVSSDLAATLPATVELVLVAGLIMIIGGLWLGAVSARYRDRWPDNLSRMAALCSVAMPNFVWAILLMLVFSYWLDLLPAIGQLSTGVPKPPPITGLLIVDAMLRGQWSVAGDALSHIILPAFALSLPGLAQTIRLTRTNMINTYSRPFIEFARAYGFSERQIAYRWAMRPSLVPTLTLVGMNIAVLLGNAFLVETVFGWPGMAKYGVEAVLRKDLNAVAAVVLVICLAFILINALVDAVIIYVNPKLRARRSK
ncbi:MULTISPECIES: ABC transporter permease [Chelativorans]|jgi:peptide/nickel transport system permease protein|uniref:Binding-protein-dependent transport systems inner membrane component n=1 Tax=Chelativorans sp. (strain BNC1) TaxID=266779 RepID=Q11LB9_CHESB|nr:MULTISPECIES: ABC transporter permease [Chelativorans]